MSSKKRDLPKHARLSQRDATVLRWDALTLVVVLGACLGLGSGYATFSDNFKHQANNSHPTQSAPPQTQASPPVPAEPSPEPTPDPVEFYVAAAGDTLLHKPVHSSARTGSGYDFNPLLSPIDPLVQGAALALCHMEVPLIPDGQQITGFPMFGSSRQIAFDLKERGWDGCSTASNHSVDKGFPGIESTLDTLDEAGLGFAGTARSQDEADTVQFYTVDVDEYSTVIAHLSYTRNLNGLPLPAGKPWSVNLADSEAIVERAKQARVAGADLVFVSVHDGVEYTPRPTDEQRLLATALAESGEIDLYIGHHPHVPQPIELLPGGVDGEGMWAAFSLGNFLSNQDSNCCVAQTANGLMMFAKVESDRVSEPRVTGVEWRALTVDRLGKHRVYDLSKAAADNTGIGTLSAREVQARYKRVVEVVGSQASELSKLPSFEGTVTARREVAGSDNTDSQSLDQEVPESQE